MAFQNSIFGFQGIITRDQIKSANYVPGVSGWIIRRDGSAEFSDLLIRSGNGSGDDVVIEDGEVKVFKGGVLVGVLSSTIPGLLIGAAGQPQVQIYTTGSNTGRVEFISSAVSETIRARLSTTVFNAGLPNENISLQMLGPATDNLERIEFLLSSANDDGTSNANFFLRDNMGQTIMRGDKDEINLDVETNAGIINADTVNATHLNSDDASLTGDFTGTGNFVNHQSGSATAPAPGGAPAQTTVNVIFPAAFGATPTVQITPVSTAANLNTTNIRWAVSNKSTSGFTINCWRDTNFATIFDWSADL